MLKTLTPYNFVICIYNIEGCAYNDGNGGSAMPKIGKRILKSSLAVFLCFIIYMMRGEQGIVFYSCIAGVLCVQQTTSNTIRVARNRVEGTLIGGCMGMLVLFFEKTYIPHDFILLQYLLISFMIIPIIYITIVLKKTTASYISCVVFMSITVSHAMDVNSFLFGIDRIVDTLIGIFVALFINGIPLPFHRNHTALFYIDMETLHSTTYETIQLNQMMEHGARIGFLCNETPGACITNLRDLIHPLPVLCFHGTLQYDVKKQTVTKVHTFQKEDIEALVDVLKTTKYSIFTYTMQYQMLHVYFSCTIDKQGQRFIEQHRMQPYDHYICAQVPSEADIFAIMLYVPLVALPQIQAKIERQFPHVRCILKEDQEGMVQLYMVPMIEVVEEIKKIAKQQGTKAMYLFLNEEVAQHTMEQDVTFLHAKHTMKKIKKYFYSFHT